MKRSFVLLMLAATITGCGEAPPVARHTVAEYRADKALRWEIFNQCVNDPGTLRETPDCVNAIEAERLESRGSLRKSAPIGLGNKD